MRRLNKCSAPSRDPTDSRVGGAPRAFPAPSRSSICGPGGSRRFVKHGPDRTDYPNANVFKTVEPPHRVEVEHISDDHHFVLRITSACQGSATLVGWEQTFDTVAHRQLVAPWVEPANEQDLHRLQHEVALGDSSGVA